MTRFAVTGAAGFIGSHVSEALLERGHEVVGIDSFVPYYPRAMKERNLRSLREQPGWSFQELDLRTAPLERLVDGCDVVIHLAAMPGLPRSWTDFELYATCNLHAVERLLAALRATECPRLIHISTSSVYGRDAVGDELLPTRPISPYGVTKLAAEHLVLAHVDQFGLNASILRYFSIYGPRQRPDMAFNRFIEAILDRRPIEVYGDGLQSRSSTFVADCVAGTIGAIDGARSGEIYNISGGETFTVLDAINWLGEAAGQAPVIRHGPARPGDQRHTHADTEKARVAFGYQATISAREGLRQQLEWQLAARGTRAGERELSRS